jgi:hypothetical protein
MPNKTMRKADRAIGACLDEDADVPDISRPRQICDLQFAFCNLQSIRSSSMSAQGSRSEELQNANCKLALMSTTAR